jgi:diacylglycerol kinase (ATP)
VPKQSPPRTDKLLIISTKAGGLTAELEAKLRQEFDGYTILEFDPKFDFRTLLKRNAKVVVAGGDGTIGFVVRALIDRSHPLGILSLGTYNNFARALGMPEDLDQAIRVVQEGHTHPVTLGRINGKPFLEAGAIGLFGEAIMMGEAAKDRHFGELTDALGRLTRAKPFDFVLKGDIEGEGRAYSLVFANTPSMGAQMPVSDNTPVDPHLELSVHVGESRRDIVGRIMASTIGDRHIDKGLGMHFKFRKLHITTKPRVQAFADNEVAGKTPADVTAEVGALQVILPRRVAKQAATRKPDGARKPARSAVA